MSKTQREQAERDSLAFLAGGGEMGERTRAFDWSQTPVGPVSEWPQSLKTAVSICLGSRYPIVLWWGREALTQFYNDGFISFLGSAKHPVGLGQSARTSWSEIWHIIDPMLEGVFSTGEATWSEDFLYVLNRNLPLEEAYFTFSYSPIRDDAGTINGIFCACYEATSRVIGERRLRTLRDLGGTVAQAKDEQAACVAAASTLATNAHDIPFALIYLMEQGLRARLVATAGVQAGSAAAPAAVDLSEALEADPWLLGRVYDTAVAQLVSDLSDRFGALPGGPWPESPEAALVVPIAAPGQTKPTGFLVAGLSPRRVLNDDYRSFFDLIAAQLATAVTNARAYEEEKRRVEALAELDRAKTAFFSNVSHEFRTPLTLMLGPVEDILARPTDQVLPDDRHLLAVVHRNGLRLQKLVNTLLDFSRIEAGRVQAVYAPIDLGAMTAELASNFRSACERAGLQLIVDCPSLPEPVYVDRDMWEKIVLNLVSNAFKFTFNGEIAVTIRESTENVELCVRDTGTGIAPEEISQIFERFHRVKGARARTHEGTGIGLALVQELVKLHGGAVRVESIPGAGTTFVVSIPKGKAHLPTERIGGTTTLASTALGAGPYVEEALRWLPDPDGAPGVTAPDIALDPAPLSASSVTTPGMTEIVGRRARILWADDNADMREYVRRLLSPYYEVEAVPDGKAALDIARARRPDLVLADVMMPNLDGFGLLRGLRANPDTRTLPVILLSARAGEESRVEGLQAGADDYLIKPFSARELVARVSAHLQMAQIRQEAARALEAADQAKDEFLATLSHELRTPLNAMLGWVRMLRTGGLETKTAQRALEVIERSVNHQRRLITDLLDISRIISGKMAVERALIDFRTVVASAVETMRPAAEAKAIALSADLGATTLPVFADSERLRQVVANLLSNAVKFTPAGGLVNVGLARVADRVRLTVSDTGAGISAAFLPHIFERFRQGDEGNARAKAGLGLGLAIVRHIVALHEGRVRAESPGPGKGARLTVELPLVHPASGSVDPLDAGLIQVEPSTDLGGMRVLVVDDDVDGRELFAAILRQDGAEVTAVETVREALTAVRLAPPDVVLCDLAMPGDDGFTFIRELRTRPRDQGGAVPAIALTAHARPEDRERAIAAGFQMHVTKPVEPLTLRDAVTRLVRGAGKRISEI